MLERLILGLALGLAMYVPRRGLINPPPPPLPPAPDEELPPIILPDDLKPLEPLPAPR